MGPESPLSNLPKRPRFQWDIKSPPWTDGKGNQEGYMKAVKLWKEFQDALPDSNSHKIPKNLQGIILKSQLFGRAQDLVSNISDEDVRHQNGALAIAKAVHKIDALSQVSNMSEHFSKLLDTKRQDNELMKSFESRFQVQVCRFHESAGSSILPESLLALMLMKNAILENSQRVSVLASVAPSSEEQLEGSALQSAIKYENVTSILCSSDAPKQDISKALSSNTATVGLSSKSNIEELKKTRACKACGQFGHWYKDDVCPKKGREGERHKTSTSYPKKTITFN